MRLQFGTEVKTNCVHHRKALLFEEICCLCPFSIVSNSSNFDSGRHATCLVGIRDDVLLFHNWESNSVHEHDFESLWLWERPGFGSKPWEQILFIGYILNTFHGLL